MSTESPKQLPKRHELPNNQTWDLESVYATPDVWRAALGASKNFGAQLAKHQGHLHENGAALYNALQERDALGLEIAKVHMYPSLQSSTDGGNSEYTAMLAEARSAYGQFAAGSAFYEPELLAIPASTLERLMQEEPKLQIYAQYFRTLQDQKAHIQTTEIEALLAAADDALSASASTSHAVTNADMTFRDVGVAGHNTPVSHSNIGELLVSTDPTLRQHAWESYADGHLALQNTLASTLFGSIKAYAFQAKARGYKSSLEMSLAHNHIPTSVFENLLTIFKNNLPTWHRYWRARKKIMGGTLHTFDVPIYDAPAPITPSTKVTFAQAAQLIVDGMKPLGEDYTNAMQRGLLQNRWVDWGQNQGKRAGAFSSGQQGTHPFIFMSWSDDLYAMSTLAHELGHSMHTHLTDSTQPAIYANYSLFVAEVASNFNQALVRHHLLQHAQSQQEKLAIFEEAFANFHRYLFVMPTLARLERELYERVEAGGAITAPHLHQRLNELLAEGYGGAVEIDETRLGSGWMNFGHLYAPFYVYQYATGIAAANALASDVLQHGELAATRYLSFLKAGSSVYPLEALQLAGIDMNSTQAVERGFAVLEKMVEDFERTVG